MPSKLTEQDREFRAFAASWQRAQKSKERSRSHEPKDKFLTEELLRNRKTLTKNGRQKLVLQYGKGTIAFTLAELNEMARKIELREDRFGTTSKGVLVGDVLKMALPIDKQRSKKIRTAQLYKTEANTLFFRAKASGETPGAPSHYSVRVRLDDWATAVRRGRGDNYFPAAQKACNGHISFDCSCGRHQYWYRYLATIGGFALMPEEHVFPKIRNPKLKGVCCKHTLKVIAALTSPVTQTQVAREMERQAKKTNFETGRGKYIPATEAEKLEKASEKASVQKAYREYKAAQKAFEAKAQTPAAKEAVRRLQERNDAKMREVIQKKEAAEMVAKKEIEARRGLEKAIKQQWIGTLKTLAMVGDLEKSIEALAKNTGTDAAVLTQIAKEEGLIK